MEEVVGMRTSPGGPGSPMREKNWDELTDSEKIERMRGIVKGFQSQMNRMEESLYSLRYHQHASNGEIVVPLHQANISGLQGGRSGEYF